MKYIDYKEHAQQGTFNFPIAFYHENPNTPRYYMPYHWHTQYEIIRIIEGQFMLTLNDETTTYSKGDVIFVTDGVIHGGTPINCTYECIVFDLQMIIKDNLTCAKTVRDIMDHKIMVDSLLTAKSTEIAPVVENLCMALAGKRLGYEFMVEGFLYQLIGIILSDHLYSEASSESTNSERVNSIKEVLDYISDNYYNNISLDTLAHIAGMNPKYFCRYFRSMTERTPIDYLNYYRVECSCEMLSTRDISIKEAAISCGFNDESYFIKTFRKYKGITPKQFMKAKF